VKISYNSALEPEREGEEIRGEEQEGDERRREEMIAKKISSHESEELSLCCSRKG
jgi:hypothetical protein